MTGIWTDNEVKLLLEYIEQGNLNSNQIGERLGKSQKAVQNKIARLKDEGVIEGAKREEKPIDIHETALKLLQRERSIEELGVSLNLTPRMLHGLIDDLNEEGYYVDEINGMFKLRKDIILEDNHFEDNWNGEKIIRLGVTADKHMASKSQQLEHCNTLYDIFKSEGITRVFDAGDLSDGYKMRPGQEHEVFVHGADDQEDYIVKNHPSRPGIITEFITGNHDASHVKSGGRDIGKGIAARRPDMKYLGMFNAKINLTPNCVIELNHPFDGASYALSYTLQKYLDSMSGGEKPNILINGHHHKAMYLFYRNVHAFEAGTLCGQTAWMRGKRIAAHVGGWIIEVHVNDEGTVTRCKGEFFPFYVMNEHDYGVI